MSLTIERTTNLRQALGSIVVAFKAYLDNDDSSRDEELAEAVFSEIRNAKAFVAPSEPDTDGEYVISFESNTETTSLARALKNFLDDVTDRNIPREFNVRYPDGSTVKATLEGDIDDLDIPEEDE